MILPTDPLYICLLPRPFLSRAVGLPTTRLPSLARVALTPYTPKLKKLLGLCAVQEPALWKLIQSENLLQTCERR